MPYPLKDRIRIERRRDVVDDGSGNVVGPWEFVANERATIVETIGAESVLAAKLQGHALVYVNIRSSQMAREITTDFRVIDKQTCRTFNVRSAGPDRNSEYIRLLCEYGVADG